MSQYGSSDNTPYQEGNLVNNPRYQGQSGGTVPHGVTGPQQESRYGAVPLSTTGQGQGTYDQSGMGVMDKMKNAVGMGPGTQGTTAGQGYGSNVNHPSEERGFGGGHGYQQGGYNQSQQLGEGYNTGMNTGADAYGQPRREGVVDKMKDAVGVGPNSGYNTGTGPQSGYGTGTGPQSGYGSGPHSGYGTGVDEYGQPRREGVVDKMKDAVGMGPNSGYNTGTGPQSGYGTGTGPQSGYGTGVDEYGQPRREGVVDKMKDTVGMGPNSGYNTGTGPQSGYGTGPQSGYGTGVDEYGQPRREGVVDKMKDAVGMGPTSGYNNRTQTGNDAYVHGNHPHGMQDRIQGVNEPTMLGGEYGVEPGFGRRDGVLTPGEHIPGPILGEHRTEPGYDMSKGHLPGHTSHHHGMGGTGLGERRGKDYEDNYDSNVGTGTGTGTGIGDRMGGDYDDKYDSGVGTGTGTGIGSGTGTHSYDDSNVGTGTGTDSYDDPMTGTGHDGTAPKKGLVAKIKDKLHH